MTIPTAATPKGEALPGRATRPAVHVTAPDGWLNDPLGLIWRDGRYELFYQYLPGATGWNPRCQWGHATSPDLLTWTHHRAALVPGDDELGCWSGGVCAPPGGGDGPRDGVGQVTMFYTSVNEPDTNLGAVRVARPADPRWERWDKGGVVVRAPGGEGLRVFRALRASHARVAIPRGHTPGRVLPEHRV